MTDIVITQPQINPEGQLIRRYTVEGESGVNPLWVGQQLSREGVTPETHPVVMDLFSGDATIPSLLIQGGWQPGEITCVDRHVSPAPMVEGVNWVYWDLGVLVEAIREGTELPPEVAALQGKFDVVTSLFHYLNRETGDSELLCSFFAKPQGFSLSV